MLPHALLTLVLAALAPPPASSSPGVAVLRLTGDHGDQVREHLARELGPSFSVRMLALSPRDVCDRLGCMEFERECLGRLDAWLARSDSTAARYVVYDQVERGEHRLVLYDATTGETIRELRYEVRPGDLVLPIVTARAIARALREHLDPPPPPTEDELGILAALDDEPPREPAISPCLSVICTDCGSHEPSPLAPRPRGCHAAAEPPSTGLVVLLGLLVVARRRTSRRALVDHLARQGRLPPDVIARLGRKKR